MTPEQKMALEMQRRQQSIFDGRGQLNEQRAKEMTASGKGDVFLGEYLHLAGIQWAPDPDGSEHCQNLARLVEYIAQVPENLGGIVGGPLSLHDQKVLYATAMLYCTGRQNSSQFTLSLDTEKSYAAQSASNAEVFFRNGGGDGTYWGKPEVREDVCRLIYKHADPVEVKADKLLQVFADAVRFETARYVPNTAEGLTLLKERVQKELFWTGWAADKANFRQWMKTRGWR